jgi:hypothetical protein
MNRREDAMMTPRPAIPRPTLDIVGRAHGRVVSSKEVIAQISSR